MKLINEIANNWEVASIVAEMDSVLKQYRGIVQLTTLNEGQLDTISDDVINAVTEIQNRINVISRARDAVDGMGADDQYKLARSKKFVMLALKRVKDRMDKFEELTKSELGVTGDEPLSRPSADVAPDVSPVDDTPSTPNNVEPVDLTPFGRQAPYILKQAEKGNLDVDSEQFEKYLDTFEMLVDSGLVKNDGRITQLGLASLASRAPASKKGSMSSDELRDLLDMR